MRYGGGGYKAFGHVRRLRLGGAAKQDELDSGVLMQYPCSSSARVSPLSSCFFGYFSLLLLLPPSPFSFGVIKMIVCMLERTRWSGGSSTSQMTEFAAARHSAKCPNPTTVKIKQRPDFSLSQITCATHRQSHLVRLLSSTVSIIMLLLPPRMMHVVKSLEGLLLPLCL